MRFDDEHQEPARVGILIMMMSLLFLAFGLSATAVEPLVNEKVVLLDVQDMT